MSCPCIVIILLSFKDHQKYITYVLIRTGGGEGRGPFEMLFLVTVLLGGWLGVVARLIMARWEMVIMIILMMVARKMMIMMTVLARLRAISILWQAGSIMTR